MYFFFLILSMILAYLAGSISFAILISRWVKGVDIRSLGNRKPGTANVGREIGKGWAALVLTGDLAKGLVPLILAKILLFHEENYQDYFALFLTGISCIAGHRWPLFFKFRGGGGLATSIGIYMFFIPVEFLAALVISFITVMLFFRKKKYPLGQIVPMFFVPLSPVLVIIGNILYDNSISGALKPGGHPWYIIAGVISVSVFIFIANIRVVIDRFSKDKPYLPSWKK